VHRTLITQHDDIARDPVVRMQQNDVHPFRREGVEAVSRRRGEKGILVQMRASAAGATAEEATGGGNRRSTQAAPP